MTTDSGKKDIEGLLNPRNVALVGASDRSGHWSRRVWEKGCEPWRHRTKFPFCGADQPAPATVREADVPTARGRAAEIAADDTWDPNTVELDLEELEERLSRV